MDTSILRIKTDDLGPECSVIRRHNAKESITLGDGKHHSNRLDRFFT